MPGFASQCFRQGQTEMILMAAVPFVLLACWLLAAGCCASLVALVAVLVLPGPLLCC